MDAGAASLLGAIVGGVATFGGTLFGEHAQLRRDASRRDTEAAEKALIAARIVQSDLVWARDRAQLALRNGKYWSRRYELKTDAWRAYREILALALNSPHDWGQVQQGFLAIETLELQAGRGRTEGDPRSRTSLSDYWRVRTEESLETIRDALAALEPLVQQRAGEVDPAAEE
jgi:hypothetical protein